MSVPSAAVLVSREDVQRAYGAYVSQGYGDTDGYYAPLSFDHWTSIAQRAIQPYRERIQSGEPAEAVREDWERVTSFDRPLQGLGLVVIGALS